jgi:hypothetical protein
MNLKGWPFEPLGEFPDNDVCGGGGDSGGGSPG